MKLRKLTFFEKEVSQNGRNFCFGLGTKYVLWHFYNVFIKISMKLPQLWSSSFTAFFHKWPTIYPVELYKITKKIPISNIISTCPANCEYGLICFKFCLVFTTLKSLIFPFLRENVNLPKKIDKIFFKFFLCCCSPCTFSVANQHS